jgi:hypothetical protein
VTALDTDGPELHSDIPGETTPLTSHNTIVEVRRMSPGICSRSSPDGSSNQRSSCCGNHSGSSGSHICSIRGPAPSGRYRSESSPCSSRSALNARDRGEGHCGADEDGDGRDHPGD